MIIRISHRSPVLDVLLPKVKQRVLATILLRPGYAWYLAEIARHLGVPPSSLQREIAQFVQAGILTRRADGNRVYFQANQACPIFPELSAMLSKTVGLADVIREALNPIRTKIDLAIIYGSIASGTGRSESDVDPMILGSANLVELSPLLRVLEEKLGRAVNVSMYTVKEFRKKLREQNHFLNSILKTQLIFVLGAADDLPRLTERSTHKGSQHRSRGTRCSSQSEMKYILLS